MLGYVAPLTAVQVLYIFDGSNHRLNTPFPWSSLSLDADKSEWLCGREAEDGDLYRTLR